MSFASILKTVLGIERAAAPILSVLVPGVAPVLAVVDPIVMRIQGSIATVEANDPRDGMGLMKASAVSADFQAGLELAQTALALNKQKLVWDDALLQAGISAQVAAFNAFAALKGSIRVVPLT